MIVLLNVQNDKNGIPEVRRIPRYCISRLGSTKNRKKNYSIPHCREAQCTHLHLWTCLWRACVHIFRVGNSYASWPRHFSKTPLSKSFPFTRKRNVGPFQIPQVWTVFSKEKKNGQALIFTSSLPSKTRLLRLRFCSCYSAWELNCCYQYILPLGRWSSNSIG